MAYTFGGGTGDDITFAAARAVGASATCCFYAGWWYPTTLTNGRFYCSAGNVFGMSVDSTTDQLRFFTDNTTDGQWTCDPNITVDKWWFIAFAGSFNNTGPAAEFRVWVGDIENPPVEFAVSNAVSPSGNFTSNSNVYAGNRGTGTVAFQGDVGWMTVCSCSTDKNNPLGIAGNGAITNEEADWLLTRWVRPLWLGQPNLNFAGVGSYANTFFLAHMPLDNKSPAYQWCTKDSGATNGATNTTINGATLSDRNPPRSPPENWTVQAPYVRR